MSQFGGHTCSLSRNPRVKAKGKCDCGRLVQEPAEVVQDEKPMWRRNLEVERDITRFAVQGQLDPTALIEFAETRAMRLHGKYVTDPMLIADRDRPHEAMEEAADGRNHCVFHLQQQPDDQRMMNALYYFIRAYEELRQRGSD